MTPSRNAVFETSTDLLDLAGTASDAQGVKEVMWSNNRGGGGVATGTTNWSIDGVSLSAGHNKITVFTEDNNGNLAHDEVDVVLSIADGVPPVVSVSSPSADEQFSVDVQEITLSGSVADNVGVGSVVWENAGVATGTATVAGGNWTIEGMLLGAGPNVIQITATDLSGNTAWNIVLDY